MSAAQEHCHTATTVHNMCSLGGVMIRKADKMIDCIVTASSYCTGALARADSEILDIPRQPSVHPVDIGTHTRHQAGRNPTTWTSKEA